MVLLLTLLLGIVLGLVGGRAYGGLQTALHSSGEARLRRDEERRLRHLTHVTMLRMLAEARRHGAPPRG